MGIAILGNYWEVEDSSCQDKIMLLSVELFMNNGFVFIMYIVLLDRTVSIVPKIYGVIYFLFWFS